MIIIKNLIQGIAMEKALEGCFFCCTNPARSICVYMRSNLSTEKKLNTLVKKSVDLKPLQILGWKGIKSKNTAILTLKYPSWEQKVRRPRVKKSGDKKSGKTSNLQGKLVFVQKWGRRTFSMEIGWFWGEIRVLWWRQLINTAVGHYLWGIDTLQL